MKMSEYLNRTHALGRVVTILAMAVMLGIPAVVCTVYGIWPTLPSIIATLSKFYSDNVDQFIARFSAVIDPILICGVGALIGIIVASIFLPIFKLSQIGGN